jgi:UDP:flavonoid glycosyltransferase YjiC (YdhE family)
VDGLLVVATAGAGGDLQPVLAAALALRKAGHEVRFIGDRSVSAALEPLGISVDVLAPEFDLGPRLVAAVHEGMVASGGDPAGAGGYVREALADWARDVAAPVAAVVREASPSAVVTSLFGIEVLATVAPPAPWVVINSTFYVGPNAPRALEEDIAPRARPLIRRYQEMLDQPALVLHATDQTFDFGFDDLPRRHHYVGPLGVWEPPGDAPTYLAEPGDPWVLVTISSQLQDDVDLAAVTVAALRDLPVRAVVTLGPDHAVDEVRTDDPNVRIEQVVSHSAVLERGALLVGHAGHGSVMKALWHGRPMVLVPWGRDQPGVAARAVHLGVARVVPREEMTVAALSGVIDEALRDQSMQAQAARHGQRLRATDPADTAASLVASLL